jgi:hypothetical protein
VVGQPATTTLRSPVEGQRPFRAGGHRRTEQDVAGDADWADPPTIAADKGEPGSCVHGFPCWSVCTQASCGRSYPGPPGACPSMIHRRACCCRLSSSGGWCRPGWRMAVGDRPRAPQGTVPDATDAGPLLLEGGARRRDEQHSRLFLRLTHPVILWN